MELESGTKIKVFSIYFILIVLSSNLIIKPNNYFFERLLNHLPDISLLVLLFNLLPNKLKWHRYYLFIILNYFIIFDVILNLVPQIKVKDLLLYVNFLFSILFISFFINLSKFIGTSFFGINKKINYTILPLAICTFLAFVYFIEYIEPNQEPFIVLFSVVVTIFVLAVINIDRRKVNYLYIVLGLFMCTISFWIALYGLTKSRFPYSDSIYKILYYFGFYSLLLGYLNLLPKKAKENLI